MKFKHATEEEWAGVKATALAMADKSPDCTGAMLINLVAEVDVLRSADMWWDVDDPENGMSDVSEVMYDAEPGQVISFLAARSLPDEFFVEAQVECRTQLGYRPATPEEIAEFKADRKADRDRRNSEYAARAPKLPPTATPINQNPMR